MQGVKTIHFRQHDNDGRVRAWLDGWASDQFEILSSAQAQRLYDAVGVVNSVLNTSCLELKQHHDED